MENILVGVRKNISKIFILALIFIGLISAFSIVSAANEKIIIKYGEEKIISPGLVENFMGGIENIKITTVDGKSTTSIQYSKVGDSTFAYGGRDIKLKANKVGDYTMTVEYYADFFSYKQTKTYDIEVIGIVKDIKIRNNSAVKTIYYIGDKVDLSNLGIEIEYTDGYNESGKALDLMCEEKDVGRVKNGTISYSPEKISKDDKKITIKYKDNNTEKEVSYDITVKVKNTNSNGNNNNNNNNSNNTNNNSKPTNTTNTTNQSEVYTNKLKVGDKLKLKDGSGWKKYKNKNMNSSYKSMTGGTTFVIEGIDGNWITIKGESTNKYLYYGPTASKYFTKVTATSDDSNSSNINSNENSNSKNSAPEYLNGASVKKGDTIKMSKGNSWNVYSDSNCKTIKTYIQYNKGLTYKIESINGNFVKLSQNGKEFGYIKWYNSNTGAKNYFSAVEASNDNSSKPENDNVDVNTKVESPIITNENIVELQNAIVDLISEILTSILKNITQSK